MNPVADRYAPLITLFDLLLEIAPPTHQRVIGNDIRSVLADLRAEDAASLAQAAQRPVDKPIQRVRK